MQSVRNHERRPIDRQSLMKVVDAERVVTPEYEESWIAHEIDIAEIPG
jgi:hypothetical protein